MQSKSGMGLARVLPENMQKMEFGTHSWIIEVEMKEYIEHKLSLIAIRNLGVLNSILNAIHTKNRTFGKDCVEIKMELR